MISFSIFIASITQIRSPSETSWPSSTGTLKTLPCSGRDRSSLPEAAAPPPARSRAAAACAARPRGSPLRRADRLPDHLDVEELAADLDLVAALGLAVLGGLLVARGAGAVSGASDLSQSGSSVRSRQVSPFAHCFGGEQRLVEGDERGEPADLVLAQRPQHPGRRLLAVEVPDDQLGEHRVVHRGHLGAGLDAGIDPDAGARGLAVGRDPARAPARSSCGRPRR